MNRSFSTHKDIFAIDPGTKKAGWAILSHQTGHVKACGYTTPFGYVSPTHSVFELRNKLTLAWENNVGHSFNPYILVVGTPVLSPDDKECDDLTASVFLSGILLERFKGQHNYLPKHPPLGHVKSLDSALRLLKEKVPRKTQGCVLQSLVPNLPPNCKRTVINAVALGEWAFRKYQLSKPTIRKVGVPA